jgi:predicted nucleic acid-binding protein
LYLLDTNIVSEIGKRRPEPLVVARFESALDADLFVSAITVEEIYFGIEAGPDGEMVRQRMERKVLHRVGVVALDEETAKLAGKLRGEWKVRGTPVLPRRVDCGHREGKEPYFGDPQCPPL